MLCIIFLTILTQVGGVALILAVYLKRFFRKRYEVNKALTSLTSVFIAVYLLLTLAFVPLIAPLFGRVPLGISGNLKPLTIATCLLNRHYVKPELKTLAANVANQMAETYPGSELRYLDANFPFFNGYPLLPHLSHSDGKKLDIALCFKKDQVPVNYAKSKIGYGGCVEPYKEEQNMPHLCRGSGYWQYNILYELLPSFMLNDVEYDQPRTKKLVEIWLEQPELEKLFLEPHLVNRFGTKHPKIRFHGCHAVRHDDHIHIQIK